MTATEAPQHPQRVLALHIRPGAELVAAGGALSRCVRAGAEVVVVSATGGESAPVASPDLDYLQPTPEALADYRAGETIQALAALGIRDHRVLGGPGAREPGSGVRRYREQGEGRLSEAPFDQVTADVRALLEDVRPDAVLTDGTDLVVGDPEAARLRAALEAACEQLQPEDRPRVVFTCEYPRSVARRDRRRLQTLGLRTPGREGSIPDRHIDAALDVRADRDAVVAALRCYRSLFVVQGETVLDAAGVARRIPGAVYLREIGGRAHYVRGGVAPTLLTGWEADRPGDHPWYRPAPGSAWSWAAPVAIILCGLLVGAMGTAVHRMRWYPGGTWGVGASLPLGLILITLGAVCAVLALRLGGQGRGDALRFAIGLVVAVSILGLPGPGGSGLILADWMGVSWMYGVPILCLLLAVIPLPGARSRVR
ncbi:MAG: PIG-L family deacetylase [Microbacteriaceae bacterium]|jgi:LmbE family N-acetylglucosaminyl deacetylase|nr:PIG-L family deacetylase [Microbacteriaceae bacterium]MCI1207272.1 PIG-L family deacetylase [Microbacteriaceae bacterium]